MNDPVPRFRCTRISTPGLDKLPTELVELDPNEIPGLPAAARFTVFAMPAVLHRVEDQDNGIVLLSWGVRSYLRFFCEPVGMSTHYEALLDHEDGDTALSVSTEWSTHVASLAFLKLARKNPPCP